MLWLCVCSALPVQQQHTSLKVAESRVWSSEPQKRGKKKRSPFAVTRYSKIPFSIIDIAFSRPCTPRNYWEKAASHPPLLYRAAAAVCRTAVSEVTCCALHCCQQRQRRWSRNHDCVELRASTSNEQLQLFVAAFVNSF